MTGPNIVAGSYWCTVVCPQCGQDELVPLALVPRLQRTPDEATLGLKVGQKAAAHRCGQTSINVVGATGEIVDQLELGD